MLTVDFAVARKISPTPMTDVIHFFKETSKSRFGAATAPLTAALFGVATMIPIFVGGFPVGADFDNHFRFALPLADEIAAGNLFPGWLAESNAGFGDPRFRFYPPLLYYALAFFRFLTGDWYAAALAVFTFLSAAGPVGVYLWTRRSLSTPTALTAAALFACAPYHLAQLYQASLLAEYAATALLPFAFLFVEKLFASESKRFSDVVSAIGGLAGVYALIATTHLPSIVIGSLALGFYALLLTDWKTGKKAFLYFAAAIALGVLASSWFWVRMIAELGWIGAGAQVNSDYYDYRNNFVFSPFSPANLNTFYGSLVAALTIGIMLPSIVVWRKILGKSAAPLAVTPAAPALVGRRLFAALAVMLGALLMTTDLSRPVWLIVPKLKDVQFPFRWLAVATVALCPVVAFSLAVWRRRFIEKNYRALHLALFLGFAGALLYTAVDLVADAEFISRAVFNQRIEAARGARSFRDWLPRGAAELKDVAPLAGNIDAGGRAVAIEEWSSHRKIFSVAAGPEVRARLRIYSYPHWQAFSLRDGRRVSLATETAPDGTLLVALPAAGESVEVVFVEPARTKISRYAALLGWTIVLSLIIIGLFKSTDKTDQSQKNTERTV